MSSFRVIVGVLLLCFLLEGSTATIFSRNLPALHVLNEMAASDRQSLMRSFFEEFKTLYKREYASAKEHTTRFGIFEDNMQIAAELNAMNPYAQFGVTQFADLSSDEFTKEILSNVTGEEEFPRNQTLLSTFGANITLGDELSASRDFATFDAPESWDWDKRGYVKQIRNQGKCGSCWAWAATETIEMVLGIRSGNQNYPDLSVQQLVDCAPYPTVGCGGGFPRIAFAYAIQRGLVPDSYYPYTARTGRCRADITQNPSVPHPGRISWWRPVAANGPSVRAVIAKYGPVTATVDATRWQLYKSGVITKGCWTGHRNHAVQIVGYDTDPSNGLKFWKVRNSWGAAWGSNGFIYLERGSSMCGIMNGITAIGV